jgi:adenine-specific DNA-methyltransferase
MSKLCVEYSNQRDLIEILDPGAGTGILSYSLVNELLKNQTVKINLDAYEIDESIYFELDKTYTQLNKINNVQANIIEKDFISEVGFEIGWNLQKKYDMIIMNPPYQKIKSISTYKKTMQNIGINTVNTYSAFMAIGLNLLKEDGILVSIVPRSFCNGLYFLPFRKYLLSNASIKQIHHFESRKDNFIEEGVLQENIIIVLGKHSSVEETVKISYSKGNSFDSISEKIVLKNEVINEDDDQCYISIPNGSKSVDQIPLTHTNTDLGFEISTGPIVDFRVKEKLTNEPNNVPLLYSVHIRNNKITWPIQSKKPNAIILSDDEKQKLCFQKGYYILLKRFTSKEEKRRIQATMISPDDLPTDYFTVENHINIIHYKKNGLNANLARGLMTYLNSEFCDDVFRKFSGHTQVNATDLRNMRYPSLENLLNWS